MYLGIGAGLGGLYGGSIMENSGGQELFKQSALMVLAGWAIALVAEQAIGLAAAKNKDKQKTL